MAFIFSLSKAHHWSNLALQSPAITEHAGLRSLIFDNNKLKSVHKSSNFSNVWLEDPYKHINKLFFFSNSQLSDQRFMQLTQINSLYNRKVVLTINTNTSSLCVTRMVSAEKIISWNGYSIIVIFN